MAALAAAGMNIGNLVQRFAEYAPNECKVGGPPDDPTVSLPFVSFSMSDVRTERFPGSRARILAGIQYSIQALVAEHNLCADMQINSVGQGHFECYVSLSFKTNRGTVFGNVYGDPAIAWLSTYVTFLEQQSKWQHRRKR
jgi:hypothetical protein